MAFPRIWFFGYRPCVLSFEKMPCIVVRCCVLVVGPDGFVHWVPAMLCYPVGEFSSFILT